MSQTQLTQQQMKERLTKMLSQGISSREEVNRLVGMDQADPAEDFRTTVRLASPEGRQRLQRMLRQGRVIARRFSDVSAGKERGCLVYFLNGWQSNSGLLSHEFASLDDMLAVVRTVRCWDYGKLTHETVAAILDEELSEPMKLPAAPAAAAGERVVVTSA